MSCGLYKLSNKRVIICWNIDSNICHLCFIDWQSSHINNSAKIELSQKSHKGNRRKRENEWKNAKQTKKNLVSWSNLSRQQKFLCFGALRILWNQDAKAFLQKSWMQNNVVESIVWLFDLIRWYRGSLGRVPLLKQSCSKRRFQTINEPDQSQVATLTVGFSTLLVWLDIVVSGGLECMESLS